MVEFAWLRIYNFTDIEFHRRCFPINFWNFQNSHGVKHLWTTASLCILLLKKLTNTLQFYVSENRLTSWNTRNFSLQNSHFISFHVNASFLLPLFKRRVNLFFGKIIKTNCHCISFRIIESKDRLHAHCISCVNSIKKLEVVQNSLI